VSGSLGRRTPDDWSHVQTHPLRRAQIQALPAPTPVAIGVNWYSAFDHPEKIGGAWWIGRSSDLGYVRGGHCVCLKARHASDPSSWWDFYDQGHEGACVGFGLSRMMSQLNRKRYFARWLWDFAKRTDEWQETNPGDDEGTSVHAGADILRLLGHVPWKAAYAPLDDQPTDFQERDLLQPVSAEGVSTVRWATSASDVLDVLGYSDVGYVDILNSWGRDFPHLVRLPATVLDRLIGEDGEAAVVTDR
jgi:hypothetical protein